MKSSPVRLAVVGSSNTDLVLNCERLPGPGETLLGGEFAQFAGGKGANQAVAAARAGAKVVFIGAHGPDDFGRQARAGLRGEGIDVRFFREKKKVSSGVALILIGGKERENMIAVARSANDSLAVADIHEESFSRCRAVIAQLEIPLPAVTAAARVAARKGIPFILNPAPARKLPGSLLQLVHTLVPNEHEAALLAGTPAGHPRDAALRLLNRGCRQVVVTLGSRGVLLAGEGGFREIPAPRVRPVDTVGAGDCFTAWLGVGIAEGLSLDEAAERAVRAASIAVTRRGAQAGMPHRREV